MASRLFDGSTWKNINGLRLWNGSAWKNAVRGWAWNGSAWKQWYPEYPINTAAPTVSGSATQGNTLSTTNGTWNSNAAYAPTGYSYQWRRGTSDISGATNSTYSTVLADVGNAISCRVTANNNRGSTPVISSNSITVTSALPGAPSGLTVTSATTTPGTFSVSTSSSAATTASGSWTAATNASTYSASTTLGSITSDAGARTFSITGGTSGSSYTVTITAFNLSGSASISWNAGSNATSYDIYVNGALWQQGYVGTSATYNWGTTGSLTVNVRSRNAAGAEATGVSTTSTISAASRQAQATGTFFAVIPTISGVTNSNVTHNTATISWSSTNQSSYSITGVGSWSGSTATTQNITGLSGSTPYTATVTVTSSTGQTASGTTSFTTTATPVIPTVSNLTFTSITNTSATINWTSTNQASYTITGLPSTLTGFTVTSRSATGLVANTTYSVTVTVTSSTGNTASITDSFTTTGGGGGSAPATPTGISNTRYANCSPVYSVFGWSAVSGATSYEIFYSTSTTNPSAGTTPTQSGITNTFFQVNNSTAWNLWVRARNANGASAWSARVGNTDVPEC